ncbi:MAG: DUF2169 domain-containing protein [Pseudomonadota bacterium]
MKISSRLPLTSLFFKHWAPDDTEVGIVVAKAAFSLCDDGLWRATDAPDLQFEDLYTDDPATSPLEQEQDIAPAKMGTDLTIRAIARARDGQARTDWPVRVEIPDRLTYEFQVRGPSYWTRKRLKGWQRTAPELVNEVPIDYSLAFGGAAPGPDDAVIYHEFNPAGRGFCTKELLDQGEDIPCAQIGLLGEFMTTDPLTPMSVEGLGPIAKSWLPRRAEAGTFDDAWKDTRHPRMPLDYSVGFWNAAPRGLQLDPPLRGDELISVAGLTQSGALVHAQLPGVACAVHLMGDTSAQVPMFLDTVDFDARPEDPYDHRLHLIWRASVVTPDLYQTAEIVSDKLEG